MEKSCKTCGHPLYEGECNHCPPLEETTLLNESPSSNDETTLLSKEDQGTLDPTILLEDEEHTDSTELLDSQAISEESDTPIPHNHLSHDKGEILFDRYKILSILGKGGMGTVYLTEDQKLDGKQWAVKETLMRKEDYQEFVDEAKMLVDLEHANLPNIIDYYPPDQDGRTYLVMDYIKGETLGEKFEERFSLPYHQVIKYGIQICKLLDYLHSHKPTPIIYRDLKPSNVMIDENDNVQLIDFGIARKYKDGKQADTVQMGTYGFASPEQFENIQTDHRTDLYSLGAMIYYLLSGGKYMYSSQEPLHILNKDVPEELSKIVQLLVKPDMRERYQHAKDVKDDLSKLRSTGELSAKKEAKRLAKEHKKRVRQEKWTRFKKQTKKWSLITASVLLVGAVLFGTYTYTAAKYNKDATIEQFEQAIIEEDKETLKDLLVSEDQRLKIRDQEINVFLDYLEHDPTYMDDLISGLEDLTDQQISLSNAAKASSKEPRKDLPFTFVKGDKKYVVIDTFKLQVSPKYITVHANLANTKILLNDKEVANTPSENYSQDFGPFMPGLYSVEAEWTSEYATLQDQQTIELFNTSEEKMMANFNLSGYFIELNSNYEEAKVFINDEDTRLLVKDSQQFGPVQGNGSQKVHTEVTLPWGTVKSDEVTVKGQSIIDLPIVPLTDELKHELMKVTNEYASSVVKSYTSNDASQLKHSSQDVFLTHKERLETYKDENQTWKGQLIKTSYDLNSFDLYQNGQDEYEVMAKASIMNNEVISKEDETEEPTLTEDHYSIIYRYDKEQSKWLIKEMDKMDSYHPLAPKVYSFESKDTEI
ncbi:MULTISPECIES: protein kinase domain-containing protein [Pontibacillus]|uniref:non-specific serine/threonine protein kinase n=1 Tax=Pontibacillus chungwhensis TaxID=265426 RepID=A0ABY8UYC0_9BACI|nr:MULTISPECIES: protein kinase [Pontibacillus]MCD5324185.1 protein kinase [Pontibacillus sp. HN14]WIF97756.1 protein kinase [Pontibacillus chungwhensis]